MIPPNRTFNGTWPYEAKFSSAAGFRQHYIDVGPRNGEILLCLHGEPTWGYVYRHMIPKLSTNYRVIVPDHMGFGKSETPENRDYTLKSHVENLIHFCNALELDHITFLAQDWGGPIAGAYALRNPDRVKRFCLMNTMLGYGGSPPRKEKSLWFEWVAKHEEEKTLQGILGEMGSTVLSVMKILGFENSRGIDQDWINAYSAPFPDRKACIGAIEFPLDLHYGRCRQYIVESLKLGNLEKLTTKPAILLEGLKDRAIHPENAIADFKALWPEGELKTFENAGHFCQEDVPDDLVYFILEFINSNS